MPKFAEVKPTSFELEVADKTFYGQLRRTPTQPNVTTVPPYSKDKLKSGSEYIYKNGGP
jgi:hypothetical protein